MVNEKAWILSLFLIGQYFIVSAQYYHEGLSISADSSLVKADSLLKNKDYISANHYYQKVICDFEEIALSTNVRQNLLYLELKSIDCTIGLKEKKQANIKLDSLMQILKTESGKESLLMGYAYFLKGRSSSKYEDALMFYNAAAEIRKKTLPKGHIDIVLSIEKLSLANRSLKNNKEAMLYSYKFLDLAKKFTPVDSSLFVRAYSGLGVQHYIEGNYDQSLSYLDTSYQIAIKCLPPTHKNIRVISMNLSSIYSIVGNSEMQRVYLNKTIELYRNNDDNVHLVGLASAYSSLGNSHYQENDFITARLYLDSVRMVLDKLPEPNYQHELLYRIRSANVEKSLSGSIAHLEKALEIIEIYPYITIVNESSVYSNLAIAYNALGIQSKRKLFLDKSLDLLLSKSPNNYSAIATSLGNLVAYYIDEGEYDLAFELNAKSIQYRRKGNANAMYLEPIHWFHYITISLAQENLSDARRFVDSTYLVMAKLEFNDTHYLRGTWHMKKAELEFKANNLDSALYHINNSISIRKDDIGFGSRNNIEALTLKHEILIALNQDKKAETFLIQAINEYGVVKKNKNWLVENTYRFNLWKAYSLLQLYQKNYLSTMSAEESVSFIKVGASLIGQIKTYYIDNIAEIDFYESIKVFFDLSVDHLYELNEKESSKECRDLLVNIIFVDRDLRSSKGLTIGAKSSSQKEREAYLVKSDMLIETLQQLKVNGENDSTYLKAKENLFSFERKSASEFSKKARNKKEGIVDFNQASNLAKYLKEAQGLVYYIDDNFIYTVSFCQGVLTIKRAERQPIEKLVLKLDPLLTDWSSWSDELFFSNSKLFINVVDSLSNILLNDELCPSNDLVIFADGVLLNLPFDILFSEAVTDEISFRNLPYLIREKQISYASYIDQLQQEKKCSKHNKQYVGIAPLYSIVDTKSNLRGPQSPLFYNQLEVSKTCGFMKDGKSLLGDKATKLAFLSALDEVDWLHLAAHASFDNQVTYQSYLSFANQDSIDDNKLYAYDIANLDLNVDLAVLSACETNKGSANNGLGLLGIAKAFQISGCNNLMITNWLVDDAASQLIITEMFRLKIDGKSTPDALHQSKIQYLNNASEKLSHPIYWAGFNYYGTINFSNQRTHFWWLLLPLFLFSIYLFSKKFK